MDEQGLTFSDIQNMGEIKAKLKQAEEDHAKFKEEVEEEKTKEKETEKQNNEIESIESSGKITLLEEQIKNANEEIEKLKKSLSGLEDLEYSKKVVDDNLKKAKKEFNE